MNLQIIEPRFEHLSDLSRSLRDKDKEEIVMGGGKIWSVLKKGYKESLYSRVALVDGRVGAMWGVSGVLLGGTGRPWFLTTNAAEKVSPISFARLYAREVLTMLDYFPKLENYCLSSYTASIKLLRLCGFTVCDPEPIGLNGTLFSRFYLER